MAFISSTPVFRSSSRLPTLSSRRPTIMCAEAPAASATPLNADSAMKMKEIYPLKSGQKVPACRCWQSNKFPICDGSHNAFNKSTGSNVGPIVLQVE